MRHLTRTLATPLAVGGLLLLGACSAGDPADDETTASPDASADDADAGTDEAAGEDDAAGDEAAEEPTGSGDASCLEGTWEVDLESVREATLTAPGFEAFSPEVTVSGSSEVTFADGAFTTVYEDQVTTMSWSMDDQEFSNVSGYDGQLTGTYTVEGGEVTLAEADTSGLTVTSTTSVNGAEIDLGTEGMVTSGLAAGGTSIFECNGDELRLIPVVAGVDTTNFVQVLNRK